MGKYTRYLLQGYELKTDDGSLVDSVLIDVIADTEEEALARGPELVKKAFYRVTKVVEFDPSLEKTD